MEQLGLLRGAVRAGSVLAGLGLCGLVYFAAMKLAYWPWVVSSGLSALTLAIVLGMILGHTLYPRMAFYCRDGVALAKQQGLRLGIVLFGLRLTLSDVLQVGWEGILADWLVLTSTLMLAWWLGHKKLGLDRQTTLLIGAGSAICGAAAILAVEPVVKAQPEKVAIAVASVVVFGTLSMFAYPWWFGVLHPLGVSVQLFSHYSGATIHEVAQVVAVGKALGDSAMGEAVIVKMIRVMLLVPFLLILSWKWRAPGPANARKPLHIPWFGLGFLLMVGVNSSWRMPADLKGALLQLDNLLLGVAMVALGLTSHWNAIRTAGWWPLALAAVLFGWLVFGGGVIVLGVNYLFH